jgi:hypothetical protein
MSILIIVIVIVGLFMLFGSSNKNDNEVSNLLFTFQDYNLTELEFWPTVEMSKQISFYNRVPKSKGKCKWEKGDVIYFEHWDKMGSYVKVHGPDGTRLDEDNDLHFTKWMSAWREKKVFCEIVSISDDGGKEDIDAVIYSLSVPYPWDRIKEDEFNIPKRSFILLLEKSNDFIDFQENLYVWFEKKKKRNSKTRKV